MSTRRNPLHTLTASPLVTKISILTSALLKVVMAVKVLMVLHSVLGALEEDLSDLVSVVSRAVQAMASVASTALPASITSLITTYDVLLLLLV